MPGETIIYSEGLNKVHPGHSEMSVPLFRGVMQVNFTDIDGKGYAVTEATSDVVTFREASGNPFQVEVVTQCSDGTHLRLPVFSQPIESISFERIDGAEWRSSETLRFTGTLSMFANAIGDGAEARRKRQQKRAADDALIAKILLDK